ncbi:MAG: glycerophosphodiester phosphodiesterase [Gammaproteobacteria bacterium]|nr:glycerophosphodiester phosphodiesterase [Gammaproteobacteria bacterium]
MRDGDVIVIAHRGASGYLPEHTLEAKAYAHALGAHYIEQDVVATRDNQLVVLHDIHLDRVTNVAEKFPERKRDDGRYYARDFDLVEIRMLSAWERRGDDGITAVFPKRFPTGTGSFRVPTLREEVKLIQGLNQATGRIAGIYPEVKSPAWHRNEGVDLSALVIQQLDDLGYRTKSDPVFLQCFDAAEVRHIRTELDCQLRLVQLIGENSWGESETDYDALKTPEGLHRVAEVADGIGPWIGQLATTTGVDGHAVGTGLTSAAHGAGLVVHPYTFRADQVPSGFESMAEMVTWFVETQRIDGLFTDFPDLALAALRRAVR